MALPCTTVNLSPSPYPGRGRPIVSTFSIRAGIGLAGGALPEATHPVTGSSGEAAVGFELGLVGGSGSSTAALLRVASAAVPIVASGWDGSQHHTARTADRAAVHAGTCPPLAPPSVSAISVTGLASDVPRSHTSARVVVGRYGGTGTQCGAHGAHADAGRMCSTGLQTSATLRTHTSSRWRCSTWYYRRWRAAAAATRPVAPRTVPSGRYYQVRRLLALRWRRPRRRRRRSGRHAPVEAHVGARTACVCRSSPMAASSCSGVAALTWESLNLYHEPERSSLT